MLCLFSILPRDASCINLTLDLFTTWVSKLYSTSVTDHLSNSGTRGAEADASEDSVDLSRLPEI